MSENLSVTGGITRAQTRYQQLKIKVNADKPHVFLLTSFSSLFTRLAFLLMLMYNWWDKNEQSLVGNEGRIWWVCDVHKLCLSSTTKEYNHDQTLIQEDTYEHITHDRLRVHLKDGPCLLFGSSTSSLSPPPPIGSSSWRSLNIPTKIYYLCLPSASLSLLTVLLLNFHPCDIYSLLPALLHSLVYWWEKHSWQSNQTCIFCS